MQSMKGMSELDFRTERLWHMLCSVVQASANQLHLFEPWVRNVGMNSSHISSLTVILQKWGMLAKTTRGGIVLSSRTERYRLLTDSNKKRNACQVLRKLILAVDRAVTLLQQHWLLLVRRANGFCSSRPSRNLSSEVEFPAFKRVAMTVEKRNTFSLLLYVVL